MTVNDNNNKNEQILAPNKIDDGGPKITNENNAKINPGSESSKKQPKKIPPYLSNEKGAVAKGEVFSSRRHSMDYVTVNGVVMRTGYDDKSLWYLLGLC